VRTTSPPLPVCAACERAGYSRQQGFTLVELLLALALSAILVTALSGVAGQVLKTWDAASTTNMLNRDARFAMQQILQAVGQSNHLLVPLNDNPVTAYAENINHVVAVTLDHVTDLDHNGIPDADNDGDGRFDEDPPADWTNDAAPGIYGIDDNGDGTVDNGATNSDDESATADLDPVNGIDDDHDGNIDEDPGSDLNGDGCEGICGVDDDGDGNVDEGSNNDDDEDGASGEDWLDPVVFYLKGTQLIRRQPVPWDEDGSGVVDGRDFIESAIADHVSQFRVERLPATIEGAVLVDITLALTDPASGQRISLNTRVRVGGAL
jgi:prepilin-type N-terminal cleavage/methylation domain-containing protein